MLRDRVRSASASAARAGLRTRTPDNTVTMARQPAETASVLTYRTGIQDANLAINCNDSTVKVTDALVTARAAQWVAKYPIFGRNAAASLYSCYGWPPSGQI